MLDWCQRHPRLKLGENFSTEGLHERFTVGGASRGHTDIVIVFTQSDPETLRAQLKKKKKKKKKKKLGEKTVT
eukprot:NODE_24664_length_615_cov_4.172131.p2 GENE.NODE_24664_length_615_cov_4.172131~~NODE_24664_length_615_cov_4.172131.p2  ORF type:complete len:73 (+),score=21.64 NODE_24664_length_615_cov_4.172131:305-523(+)